MKRLTNIRLNLVAALTFAVAASAHAQKGKASELQPVVKKTTTPPPAAPRVLPAPARFTVDATPTGAQLHWATVAGTSAYWIYRVANASAPDTGLIGNLPAINIPAGKDGAFFDAYRNAAVYRIRAVEANNKRGDPAQAGYTPAGR